MKKLFNKRNYFILGMICCLFMWLQMGIESYAFTRTTGSVTGSSVKVRESASTTSDVVASVKAGDVLDVTDAVSGSDGKTWYKILINANEIGYIRSDFVSLKGGEQTTSTTVDSTNVTAVENQKAHTNTSNVKVRKEASTQSAELDRLAEDVVFTITGSATGTDGKVWYQVTYVDAGKNIAGFIRSDLVEIIEETEPEQPVEPEEPTEPDTNVDPEIPTPSVNYEAVYTTDAEGNYVWYLYDRTAGQRYKIEQLLQVDLDGQKELEELSDANFGLKIGLIITICIIVMMVVSAVFYFLKLKDMDDEPEPTGYRRSGAGTTNTSPARRSQGQGSTQGVRPQGARPQGQGGTQGARPQGARPQGQGSTQGARPQGARPQGQGSTQGTRPQGARPQGQGSTQGARPQGARPQGQGSAQGARPQGARPQGQNQKSQSPEKQKTSWKAKNFLEDNDEFEFGFLDFEEDDE